VATRELGVPVPAPNSWRIFSISSMKRSDRFPLTTRSLAVQEYGVPSPALLAGLAERGAQVLAVLVYEWSLPEDTSPLHEAVHAVASTPITCDRQNSAEFQQLLESVSGQGVEVQILSPRPIFNHRKKPKPGLENRDIRALVSLPIMSG